MPALHPNAVLMVGDDPPEVTNEIFQPSNRTSRKRRAIRMLRNLCPDNSNPADFGQPKQGAF
jgi:hypothetical protein